MEIRILGPLEVLDEKGRVSLGGPKQRTVLAHLTLRANQLVSAERLIDEVWGEDPPEAAKSSLQSYVSHLRDALGSDRLEGRSGGYVLHAAPEEIDAFRFGTLLEEAKRVAAADPAAAVDAYDEALALWRGGAFEDLGSEPSLRPEVARLEELRMAAIEQRIAGELSLGGHAEVVPELETLIGRYPLRERLWGNLMVALYRSGRQGDALASYQRAREVLSEELGIDPSPELQRLQEQILRQDPSLELAAVPLRGYRLLDQVGEGAYGAVHRAFQPEVGREVAIKIIHPRLANHPEFIRRFATEAQLVARLEHPHIVPLYDYWREPDGAYLVMRYLRGGSLRQALAHGPLEAERAVTLVDQLALALGAAHRQGVVHRDVKPANILFDAEGNAYLSDFGIAKDLAAAEAATERGTPSRFAYYTSPEEARGEPPTHRADIYSLGLVLYELLTGRHPFAETPPEKLLESHMREPVPSVRAIRPEIPAILDEVIARATAKEPSERYPDVSTLAASFREAFLFPVGAIAEAEILEVRNPYKGLRAFLEADAPDFFGREALTEALVDSMRAETAGARFAAVVGPSGSGKSSVVRAGLIPAIRRGALPGSDGWFIVDMLPGAHPFEELEVSLLRIAVDPLPGLMEQLERTDDGLVHVAEEILPTDDSELVLVIDQFEEVFSLVDDENVRARFLGIILAAVTDPRSRIRVVVTLRGDFYDRPLLYREFGDLLSARTRAVTPLTVEELERAVSGPAEQAGLRVEPPLAAEIVSEVANQPGALPLLQYALTELFERRVDSTLTADAYHEVGGVAGALSRRAEALYDRLNRAGKEATRQLFLRLVTVGEGGIPDTRRVVPRAELISLDVDREALEGVIDTFGARRLLSFDRDPDTRGPTVEVAHEALLREWSRLREWVEAAREDLRTGRQLAIASREWVEAGREPSFLVAGSRLEQFETWRATSGLSITPQEHEFLEASVAERERLRAEEMARLERERALERRSIRRLRAFVAVLTLAAIVASGLTVFAFNQRGRAQREASVATARELAAGAVANLEVDPERSILLAMEAVRTHRTTGVPVGKDAVEALHRAVQASRIVRTIRPGGGAQFSRDGKILATGGGGGFDILAGRPQRAVVLWDAETGERLRTMTGHTARIIDSEFSPDGSLLVGASVDDSVIVWDVATGRPRMTVKAAHDGLISASFGPRGDRVATSGVDGILRVWEVETGEELLSIDAGSGLLGNQFSPDGKLVASGTFGGNDRAQVWDAQTGEEVLTIPHDLSVTSVKFSPDGSRLATASFDGRARVWDLRTGRELATLEGHTGWLYHIDFSSDGSRVATGSADATARVWEARTGKQLLVLSGHRGSVGNVSFSPDGTRLATGSDDGTARIWDITPEGNREVVTIPGQIDFGTNVAYTPDATRLLAPDEEDTLGVWDASTGMLIRRFAFDKGVYDVAVDPGGDRLAVTSSRQESPRVTVADASSGQTLQVLEADTGPELLSATFSPDGTLLAVIAVGGGTAVWNVETGETLATFVHQDSTLAIHRVAFSPDGTYLATSGEGSIKLWEPASGREVSTISTEGILVFSARFAPDGRSLVGGLGDGTARIWDVDSGQEVLRLSGHTGSVWDAAFNPDGTLIATAGEDTTVRLWDPASGRETLKLTGHAFAVNELAFSPDGTRLATASGDGTVRVYLLGLDDLMDLARERVNRSLTEEECRRFLHLEHCPSTP